MPVSLVRENLREIKKHKNRALDEVVSEASKHGIKIKPLHGASNTSDDIALIRKDKKPDKKFIGLGRKFYGFRNPEEEEEDLKEFSSLAKAQCDICLVIFHILFTLDSIYLKFRRIIPQSILKSPKVVQSRTTDAQRENSFYCTAENSIPIPNF